MNWNGIIKKYQDYLPVKENTPIVTLLEGNTPLIKAQHINRKVKRPVKVELYFKYEGLNPTGSFKDRGMTLAISKALEAGSKAVICASTGNTSASAAAYAARAGMMCAVIIPKGAIAMGKLAQSMVHNAKVVAVNGNFDDCLRIVREIDKKYDITLVNSINPFRIEGQKTAAFEICDQLGCLTPEYHFIPVGNAGNITAYWKGYCEYFEWGQVKTKPKMMGFQAAGAAPIVEGHPIADPHTIATAIKIGNPASWQNAEEAARKSGGLIDKVTDEEILDAYNYLAGYEGVFVEPASAASVAGFIKMAEKDFFGDKPFCVVCTLTGHGLKDPQTAMENIPQPAVFNPSAEEIARYLEL